MRQTERSKRADRHPGRRTGIRQRPAPVRGFLLVLCVFSGAIVLQSLRTAAADSPVHDTGTVAGQQDCRGVDPKTAHARAVAAARKSQYRQAGQCYLAAGNKPKADLQFVKAAAADSVTTKRQLAGGVKQAKAQFSQLREAFASH